MYMLKVLERQKATLGPGKVRRKGQKNESGIPICTDVNCNGLSKGVSNAMQFFCPKHLSYHDKDGIDWNRLSYSCDFDRCTVRASESCYSHPWVRWIEIQLTNPRTFEQLIEIGTSITQETATNTIHGVTVHLLQGKVSVIHVHLDPEAQDALAIFCDKAFVSSCLPLPSRSTRSTRASSAKASSSSTVTTAQPTVATNPLVVGKTDSNQVINVGEYKIVNHGIRHILRPTNLYYPWEIASDRAKAESLVLTMLRRIGRQFSKDTQMKRIIQAVKTKLANGWGGWCDGANFSTEDVLSELLEMGMQIEKEDDDLGRPPPPYHRVYIMWDISMSKLHTAAMPSCKTKTCQVRKMGDAPFKEGKTQSERHLSAGINSGATKNLLVLGSCYKSDTFAHPQCSYRYPEAVLTLMGCKSMVKSTSFALNWFLECLIWHRIKRLMVAGTACCSRIYVGHSETMVHAFQEGNDEEMKKLLKSVERDCVQYVLDNFGYKLEVMHTR